MKNKEDAALWRCIFFLSTSCRAAINRHLRRTLQPLIFAQQKNVASITFTNNQ